MQIKNVVTLSTIFTSQKQQSKIEINNYYVLKCSTFYKFLAYAIWHIKQILPRVKWRDLICADLERYGKISETVFLVIEISYFPYSKSNEISVKYFSFSDIIWRCDNETLSADFFSENDVDFCDRHWENLILFKGICCYKVQNYHFHNGIMAIVVLALLTI